MDTADPQSLNRYSYVLNNPLKYTDSSGFTYEEVFSGYADDTGIGWGCGCLGPTQDDIAAVAEAVGDALTWATEQPQVQAVGVVVHAVSQSVEERLQTLKRAAEASRDAVTGRFASLMGAAEPGGQGAAAVRRGGPVTEAGLTEIAEHLRGLPMDPIAKDASEYEPNARMIERLRSGNRDSEDVAWHEQERIEASLRREGQPQEEAHRGALGVQGIRNGPGYERHLYRLDVIRNVSGDVHPAARPG